MKTSIQMNNTNEIAPTSLSYTGGGDNLILVQLVENNNPRSSFRKTKRTD